MFGWSNFFKKLVMPYLHSRCLKRSVVYATDREMTIKIAHNSIPTIDQCLPFDKKNNKRNSDQKMEFDFSSSKSKSNKQIQRLAFHLH
ncbi:hypothetical protein YC2023_092321 [Brassica napus]